MKVSVIIPMYNSERTIVRCLESVFKQTYRGTIEIIIINDGSKDQSKKIVEELIQQDLAAEFIVKLIDQENSGVSKARNAGLKSSSGKFIALLDSDDEWLPRKLEKQLQILEMNKEIDFLGCSRNHENLQILCRRINTIHKATVKELLIKMYPQTSTAIFKRSLYERFGGYNENLTHGEDGDLWIRYCANSNFYYSPESLVITDGGKPSFGYSGLSANLKEMQKGSEYIIKEARRKKLISFAFFSIIYMYSKLKFIRRIIITKLR